MKFFEILPTFIILVISATAFFSGFYQSNLNNQVNNLNDEIAKFKQDQTRIDNKYQLIYQRWESDRIIQQDSANQAKAIDSELAYQKTSLTASQIDTYLSEMVPYWNEILYTQEDFILVQLNRHFEINGNFNPYVIATQKENGYDYNITINMWNSWQSTTGTNVVDQISIVNLAKQLWANSDLFLSYLHNTTGIWNYASNDNQTFLLKSTGIQKLDYIFLAPSRDLTTVINQKQQKVNDLESRIKLVTQGVTIVSIATILGGIMVNRISDKENSKTFNQIKKSLDIIPELPQEHKDLISLPVLLIAGILSIMGLLVPLLL